MAQNATIFKAELAITDMVRHYYQTHQLTIAQHPSENDTRMMVRLLSFALNASESLAFGRGVSTDDEPDLWQKNLHNDIDLWIDLGQPDEKRLRKACNQAEQVKIYTYQPQSAEVWWQQNQNKLQRMENLSVYAISAETVDALENLVHRTMRLQCTIDEDNCWLSDGDYTVDIKIKQWK